MEAGCDTTTSSNNHDSASKTRRSDSTSSNGSARSTSSTSLSKSLRGLKRILFGSRSSEKESSSSSTEQAEKTESSRQKEKESANNQQRPVAANENNNPHPPSRARRVEVSSSDDDEGVILSESYTGAESGSPMEGLEEPLRQRAVGSGVGGGALFLPAFSGHSGEKSARQGRPRNATNAAPSDSSSAARSAADGAGGQSSSWSKVRHSSSHRSLSSQSSEKEEGYASSRASHGSRESIDLDSLARSTSGSVCGGEASQTGASGGSANGGSSSLLPSEAMKHRIAVRPRRRHAVGASSHASGTSTGSAGNGGNAELPSLKEEPGYLSNAAYTPAPFVVNQQSIGQQLSRKLPLSVNNTANTNNNSSNSNSNSVTSSSAAKVMKQTSSSSSSSPTQSQSTAAAMEVTPTGSTTTPNVASSNNSLPPSSSSSSSSASVIGPKPSVVQRGIKLPGFEPMQQIGTPITHKPAVARPPQQTPSATPPVANSGAVGATSATDDELAKVLSRLRKVNTTEESSKPQDSNNTDGSMPSLNLPVTLRKTNNLPPSELSPNNEEGGGDKLKPATLPKPFAMKNRQTVCLASLPFSEASASSSGANSGAAAGNPSDAPFPISFGGRQLTLTDRPSSIINSHNGSAFTPTNNNNNTNNFPKSTSLNFAAAGSLGGEPPKPARPSWMKPAANSTAN